MDLAGMKSLIAELADASGAVITSHFANPNLAIEIKSDQTPVTVADRQAEEVMRSLIRKRYPNHGILGEELGTENPDAEFTWVLDPIDGTKAFATACPLFGTLIGLLHNGKPVLGAIHQPVLRQLCIGDGKQTLLNGRPVRVRTPRPLEEATVLSTSYATVECDQPGDGFSRLVKRARIARTWGDCYGYLLLATGFADVMLDPVMNPWDILPLIPVIEGAGGVITDWQGKDAATGKSCVAAIPALHPQVIAELNK